MMELNQRVCLRCRKKFLSESSGNRICGVCKKSNRKVYVMDKVLRVNRRGGAATTE